MTIIASLIPRSIHRKPAWQSRWMAVVLLFLCSATGLHAQDTIVLYGDTIRVGALEWDMQKDWRAKGTRITENRQIYGDHVRILLSYHRNRNVAEIAFGYIDKSRGFIKHGPARYYYATGQLLSKRQFVEDQMQGPAMDYYPDGKLRTRTQMLDGQLHGAYESFFPDGTRESTCAYVHDSLDGKFLSWYSNGQLKRIEHWAMDAKVGVDSLFYEDGKLESTRSFVDDLEDGPMHIYHRNGTPWAEWIYDRGRLKSITFVQSNKGNPLEIGTFWDGNGWVNLYDENGLLREQLRYKDGYMRRSRNMRK